MTTVFKIKASDTHFPKSANIIDKKFVYLINPCCFENKMI